MRIEQRHKSQVLKHYHVPGHAQGMISSNFSSIQFRFSMGDYTTSW